MTSERLSITDAALPPRAAEEVQTPASAERPLSSKSSDSNAALDDEESGSRAGSVAAVSVKALPETRDSASRFPSVGRIPVQED